ncbi:hypothetical protein [Shimia thalassica]|nr:hypothetical protein [Shimia thalassica]
MKDRKRVKSCPYLSGFRRAMAMADDQAEDVLGAVKLITNVL